jgi:F0F1-type ATP synthase membrane subunit b/b'
MVKRSSRTRQSRARNTRRWQGPLTVAASVLALTGGGLGVALADTSTAAAAQIACPNVADELPAVPAGAQAEVARNLALLDTQIAEANRRLVSSVGQGGPNFAQNAILGPLADKRRSTIDRIALSIGRSAPRPTGLDRLADCALSNSAAGNAEAQDEAAPPAPPAAPAAPALPAGANDPAAGQRSVDCPAVAPQLAAVPEQARAEVDSNLALLNAQIAEANRRLASSVGQGGPNFAQNAIVGPLEDKRLSTINRIATAIGRVGTRPGGLETLADCSVRG